LEVLYRSQSLKKDDLELKKQRKIMIRNYQLALSSVTALIAAVGISSAAQAITIRHDRWQGSYIGLGSYFPSVGRMFINNSKTCSGTLITRRWVLTAGHCIDDLRFANFDIGLRRYFVTRSHVHPRWFQLRDNFHAGVDIGLIQLNQPVWNVSPALLYTGFDEVGKVGIHVGFGNTGNGLTGSIYSDGRKRGAYNAVDATGGVFGWSNRLLLSDFDSPWYSSNRLGSPVPFGLEGSTAVGDSGGALFINGYLAGITSDGTDRTSRYGTVMLSTRVSVFRRWISSVINGATSFSFSASNTRTANTSTRNLYSAQNEGAKTVPEPSSLVGLLSVAGLLGLLSRRKSNN
jgi:Trypsin/PEP-CTERM motif